MRRVFDVASRKWHVAPIDAAEFRCRRIPRMVWVWKTHPAEPVIVGLERIQPGDRAISNPVGVVPLSRHCVVVHLRRTGLATALRVDLQGHVEHRVEHRDCFGMVRCQPAGVVQRAEGAVGRRFEVLETTMEPDEGIALEAVFDEAGEGVQERLEVWLSDQRGAVASVVQHARHGGSVDRQGDPVHPYSVSAWVLAGDDRRPRWHAHHRLRMGSLVAIPPRGQPVDYGSASQRAAVASERVVTLLITGDEQDLAAHQRVPW